MPLLIGKDAGRIEMPLGRHVRALGAEPRSAAIAAGGEVFYRARQEKPRLGAAAVTHAHETITASGWAGPAKLSGGFVHNRRFGGAALSQIVRDIREMVFAASV